MEEKKSSVFSKTITTEKGEALTLTIKLVNTSPKKKIVQDLLSELFSDLLSEF